LYADAIILGTGLTECIISGLLSVNGKRVLHLDRYLIILSRDQVVIVGYRNNYYGADTASLSLANLFKKFRDSEPSKGLGHSRG